MHDRSRQDGETTARPLVSVVTPAYRAQAHIGQAIKSVQAQEIGEWEMLIVDDGSPDRVAGVVEGYAAQDSRLRLMRQDNAGPAAARQAALDAARGRYIAFLDSDDYWLPGKIARQLQALDASDAALCFTAYRRISPDGGAIGRLVEVPSHLSYRGLLKRTAIATSTVVVDTAATGPLRTTRTYYDDYVLWLGILKQGHGAIGLNEDLMRYRVLEGSVSRNKFRSARWVWHTYRQIEGLAPPYALWCFVNYAWNGARKYARF